MLRDIPKIYLMFLAFTIILVMFLVSYSSDFIRGGETLTLNDIVLTSAVSKVDEMSRLNEGTLILEDDFEKKAWEELENKYPEGSEVEFDYLFYKGSYDPSAKKPEDFEKGSSDIYTIGGNVPSTSSGVFKDKPVKSVRIKVRKTGDNVTSDGTGWTYTSTVKLDVADD